MTPVAAGRARRIRLCPAGIDVSESSTLRISAMALPRSRPSSRAVTATSWRESSRRSSSCPGSSTTFTTCESFTSSPVDVRIGRSSICDSRVSRDESTFTRMSTIRSPSSTEDAVSPSMAVLAAFAMSSAERPKRRASSGPRAEADRRAGVHQSVEDVHHTRDLLQLGGHFGRLPFQPRLVGGVELQSRSAGAPTSGRRSGHQGCRGTPSWHRAVRC